MYKVSIQPQWTIRHADGMALSPKLLALLLQVHESGSLSAACRQHGASYRHAWELVRTGEAMFGAPLLRMERGKGSSLTELGETLVWADRRIAARLDPALASLSSELEVEIERVVSANPPPLRVHASHGFAVETMFEAMARRQVSVERKYVPSVDAVASLHDGGCDLAGFHVPLGDFEGRILAEYARWLDPATCRVVCTVKRRQGLMVAAGNPLKIYDVRDLARPEVRFINRQRGSGTRLLLECMLEQAGMGRTTSMASSTANIPMRRLPPMSPAGWPTSGSASKPRPASSSSISFPSRASGISCCVTRTRCANPSSGI